MQVPERLALIGGGILLSSTLIFTLKGQASQIIPKVGHSISGVFNHIGDAQKSSDFDSNFQQAQKSGWKTGTWGSSKYYIDNEGNIYVGEGKLNEPLTNLIGQDMTSNLKTVNIVQHVQAPKNSSYLFGKAGQVNSVYGLNNLDTSQTSSFDHMFVDMHSLTTLEGINQLNTSKVSNMNASFAGDNSLSSIDLSGWDTNSLQDISYSFLMASSLKDINLSNWNTPRLTNTDHAFGNIPSLQHLDIRNLNTRNANMYYTLGGDWSTTPVNSLRELDLGNNTILKGSSGIPRTNWKSENQVIYVDILNNGDYHPGTWIKQ